MCPEKVPEGLLFSGGRDFFPPSPTGVRTKQPRTSYRSVSPGLSQRCGRWTVLGIFLGQDLFFSGKSAVRSGAAALAGWILCFVLLFLQARAVASESAARGASEEGELPPARWMFSPAEAPDWQFLAQGLEIAFFPGLDGQGKALEMVILRINPRDFVFSVHAATQEGQPQSLTSWARRHGLTAAINASMYLPDGLTSTGYLRVGGHVNNSRMGERLGAFFVSEPGEAEGRKRDATPAARDTLPEATLLDRTVDDWRNLLPRYRNVVQNYRIISADRRILWKPGGPRHAIAAVGRDGKGHILFIHCREPLTGADFGSLLLELPIDVRLVMYTEGGSQAGLFVQSGPVRRIWTGRHPADIWTSGGLAVPLPNVIGIRPRTRETEALPLPEAHASGTGGNQE